MRYLYFRNRDTEQLEAVDIERVVRFSQARSHKTDSWHPVIHLDDGVEVHAEGKLESIVNQAERLAAADLIEAYIKEMEAKSKEAPVEEV